MPGAQDVNLSARLQQRIHEVSRARRRTPGRQGAPESGSASGGEGKAPPAKRQRGDWARTPAPPSGEQPPAEPEARPAGAVSPTAVGLTAMTKAPSRGNSREPSPVPNQPSDSRGPSVGGPREGKDSGSQAPKRERRRSSRWRDEEPQPVAPTEPAYSLSDLGGMSKELEILNELVCFPLVHPELYDLLGSSPPLGVLLHGPPGTGKTRITHALAHAVGVPFFAISGPEIISGVSGDSEAKLRALFTEAAAAAPSLILLDEVDVIAGRRDDAGKAMEARIVSQLLTCMDGLATLWKQQKRAVVVIGATNRPEVIDSALRRAGRFDREVGIGIPSLGDRQSILEVLVRGLRTSDDVDLRELAFLTPGYVGADLHAAVKEAATVCMRRIRKAVLASAEQPVAEQHPTPQHPTLTPRVQIPSGLDLEAMAFVSMTDFRAAVERVQPSSMREGFSTIPDVTWDDVGALEDVREEINLWVQRPIRHPALYKRVGLGQPCGLLLFGPPGCGKTLVAKAVAHEASANFISVKGPELLNKYVGESERAVRMVFARGRASAPCVLFFDELDALAPKRGLDRSTPGAERLVNQLLTEMDGVEGREQVYVIAATNRVDMIDTAMLRPGRFDKILYVPLPTAQQRVSVLQALVRKTPLNRSVDLQAVARDERCEGFSGADCKALVREAAMQCVRGVFEQGGTTADTEKAEVTAAHFEAALQKVRPSVSADERQRYEKMWQRRQRDH